MKKYINYMKNFIKEKTKNKFLLAIIWVIIVIIWYQWYKAISLFWVDTDSYVVLIQWEWLHNENKLSIGTQVRLDIEDKVHTVWVDSIAIIEWGDGSITRLGGDSEVIINELHVKNDLSQINLSFSLLSWKSWSNVVSFLWEDSHFKQNFQDVQASVRWTVFDVDLTDSYVFVQDHEVELQKWDAIVVVKENSAFDIRTFSLIELQKFLNEFRDKAWEDINKKLDVDYFSKLRTTLQANFSQEKIVANLSKKVWASAQSYDELEKTIATFSDEKKKEAYDALLEQYQKLNFVKSWDWELFEEKNNIKKMLINSAEEEDKKALVKYSVYDLKDAIDGKDLDWIQWALDILGEHKELLPDIDTSILKDIDFMPDSIQEVFRWQMEIFKWLLPEDMYKKFLGDISLDWFDGLSWSAKGLLDSSTKKATQGLDAAKWKLEGLINNFK